VRATNPYRPLIVLFSTVLIVASLYLAQKILIPAALAILLAFVLGPLVVRVQRRGLSRAPAVLIVVGFALLLVIGIGAILALQIRSLALDLSKPQYKQHIVEKAKSLLSSGQGTFLGNIQASFRDILTEVSERPGKNEEGKEQPVPVRIEPAGDYTQVFTQMREALDPALEALATAGLVVILLIFMLIKREDLRNRIVYMVGHGRLIVTTRAIDEAAQRISRFLIMQATINATVGVCLSVGLFIIQIPYALLWGLLLGLLRFVPYLGILIGASLVVLFSLAVSASWFYPLLVLGLILGIELVAANVVEPLVLGHSTGISAVALLFAAAFWTWLWGPIGLILSTPITACLVVLGKYVPQLEFFSTLMGDETVLDTEVTYYQRLLARDQDEATELVERHLQANPAETVYDQVLIPALVLAKRDRENGELAPEEERFILQATTEVLNELVSPQLKIHAIVTKGAHAVEPDRPQILVFGCPARDDEDALALQMLQPLLAPHGRLEVLSSQTLSGELLVRVEQEKPTVVCIASLPPGGMTLTRYLCKRLRQNFSELPIVVGRWGETTKVAEVRERLQAAGATTVVTTLLEGRDRIVPLLQIAGHQQPAMEAEKLTPATTG
jgi:predicted PurR-regulated permease PerM